VKRREFITLLGGAAAWPLAARAQQPAMPVVGVLSGSSPDASRRPMSAFQRALTESGFIEGQSVTIDYRWAEGRFDLLPAMAAAVVRRPVALIVTFSPPAALAARAATSTIPIVFHSGGDVITMGLVVSLNRPGSNATGVNLFTQAVEAKKLDLLNKLVPTATTFAYLINPNNPAADATIKEISEAARQLGPPLDVISAGTEGEIDAGFAKLSERRMTALVVMADQYFDEPRRAQLIALAARHAIPTIYGQREYAIDGGLISYGTDLAETHRQVGSYAGRILKGAKPEDLPVLRPTKFELFINLKTAKTLGLSISDNMLTLADEVIE
jgi:putative tryptophan/tyrosine transport system substrate-binding protein